MLNMYAIDVIETLRKRIVVEAATEDAAYQQVVDRYLSLWLMITLKQILKLIRTLTPKCTGRKLYSLRRLRDANS